VGINDHTDSTPFQDLVPAISLRELERGAQIGAGWDPTHHQPIDVYSHFSEGDFRLGLNATQTTLGAVANSRSEATMNRSPEGGHAPAVPCQSRHSRHECPHEFVRHVGHQDFAWLFHDDPLVLFDRA